VTTALADTLGTFIIIPTHEFLMGTPERDLSHLAKQYGGTRESYREESPQHAVAVSTYAIAQTPVCVAAYAHFVAAGGTPPTNWQAQSLLADVVVSGNLYDVADIFDTNDHHRC